MKLAAKLTAFVLAAMLLVFAVRGYQAAYRQMVIAETRARENSLLLGRALRPALIEIWRREGTALALEMLSYAADRVRRTQQLDLRFVRTSDGNGPGGAPFVRPDQLARLLADDERIFVEKVAGNETLLTYLPVVVGDQQVGAFEVSGPLTEGDKEFRAEIMQIVERTGVDFFTAPPPPFASFTSLSSLLGLCLAGTAAVCGLRGDFGSRRRGPDPPSPRARHSAHAHAQAPRKHTICRPLPCRPAVWPRPLSLSEGPSGAWMGQGPHLLSIAPLACRVARG